MPLLLFDLDGTLLKGLGPYESSLEQAVQETFNKKVKVDLSTFNGLTDRRIVQKILGANEIIYSNYLIDSCLSKFGEMYQASTNDTKIIEGVSDALSELTKSNSLGIVTGNVEKMARKKLSVHNIEGYFPFGAFGNESYDRSDLVTFAMKRALDRGWNGDKSQVYVIGDTPRDVSAALQSGVVPIGVTTGRNTYTELKNEGARFVIDNLTELQSLIK